MTVDDIIMGHARERLRQLELSVETATKTLEQAEALCRARAAELKAYSRQRDELSDALARFDESIRRLGGFVSDKVETGPSPSSDEDAVAAAPVAPLQDRVDSA